MEKEQKSRRNMGDRIRAIELYNEGLLKAKEGNLNGGREALWQSIREDSSRSRTYTVLGKIFIQQGEREKARWCWETSLVIDPLDGTARRCLDALMKLRGHQSPRVILLRAGMITMTVALLLTVILLHRQVERLTSEPSGVVESEEKRAGGSLVEARRLEQVPSRPSERQEGGSPAEPQRVKQASARLPERRGGGIEQVETIYARGRHYCREKRYNEAMAQFKRVLTSEERDDLKDNATYWIGECYYAKEEYKRALETFIRVSEHFPTGNKAPHAKLMTALCYERLGQHEEALNLLKQLLEEYPATLDSTDILRIIARLEKKR